MKKRFKVGFVVDDGLDSLDGVQQYILSLGKWLTKKGHEVHYLTGETSRKDIPNVHTLSKNLKVRFNGNTLSTPLPASKRKIKNLLNEEKFDILHVQVPYSPFMAARVVRLAAKDTKIVGTFHILPFGRFQSASIYLLGLLLRRNSRKFDRMLAVSEPAAELSRSAFGRKAKVLPNTVTLEDFKTAGSKTGTKQPLKIIFMGRLVRRKGVIELVKAVNIIKSNGMNKLPFKVEIGGLGPLEQTIQASISDYGLAGTVKLAGYVDEKDKPEFLSSGDIAIFPSLGGESFGIVLLEAMAAGGATVIAGDNQGYRSVLGEVPGSLIDTSNAGTIAKRLADLINDKSKRDKIYRNQQRIVKQYDINIVGRELEKIYQNLVKSG